MPNSATPSCFTRTELQTQENQSELALEVFDEFKKLVNKTGVFMLPMRPGTTYEHHKERLKQAFKYLTKYDKLKQKEDRIDVEKWRKRFGVEEISDEDYDPTEDCSLREYLTNEQQHMSEKCNKKTTLKAKAAKQETNDNYKQHAQKIINVAYDMMNFANDMSEAQSTLQLNDVFDYEKCAKHLTVCSNRDQKDFQFVCKNYDECHINQRVEQLKSLIAQLNREKDNRSNSLRNQLRSIDTCVKKLNNNIDRANKYQEDCVTLFMNVADVNYNKIIDLNRMSDRLKDNFKAKETRAEELFYQADLATNYMDEFSHPFDERTENPINKPTKRLRYLRAPIRTRSITKALSEASVDSFSHEYNRFDILNNATYTRDRFVSRALSNCSFASQESNRPKTPMNNKKPQLKNIKRAHRAYKRRAH